MKEFFNNLYNYRQLLKSNVQKDIRGKYKGSFLGVLWSFVNPLLTTLVYAIIFPLMMQTEPNYVTFLIVAILPWNYFTSVVMQATNTIIINSGIIKKVYFPREILPVSANISGLINFMISCLIIFIFLIATGVGFSWYLLFLPLLMIIQFILLQGIIFITSAINVYVRDAEYIIAFILNMLFYATPILYSADMFANSKFGFLAYINPMVSLINSYRDILYYQSMPRIKSLAIIFIFSCILCYVGLKIFKRLEKGFAEEV